MQPDEVFAELCHELGLASDTAPLCLAYYEARRAHETITRGNGDPYIMHSLGTAKIVAEWGLGPEMAALALLHSLLGPLLRRFWLDPRIAQLHEAEAARRRQP